MGAEDNIKSIQMMYEAFGRADAQAIIDGCAEDVDWATEAASTGAPWYGIRHGKDRVMAFFGEFGSAVAVEEFTPVSFAANDTDVHTVVRMRAQGRANGKRMDMHLHHFFRFNDEGKVSYYRGSEDTALTEKIFAG